MILSLAFVEAVFFRFDAFRRVVDGAMLDVGIREADRGRDSLFIKDEVV